VLLSYLPAKESDADETARLVEAAGLTAVRCPGNIRNEENCSQIIDTAVRELGASTSW